MITGKMRRRLRMFAVGVLVSIGLIVVSGEPTGENFLLTYLCQIGIAAALWIAAAALWHKWNLTDADGDNE